MAGQAAGSSSGVTLLQDRGGALAPGLANGGLVLAHARDGQGRVRADLGQEFLVFLA